MDYGWLSNNKILFESIKTSTYLWVLGSVVANEGLPPEVVETASAEKNVGVVGLVVVADPCSDHSPHGFPGWISTESWNSLWSSSYTINNQLLIPNEL